MIPNKEVLEVFEKMGDQANLSFNDLYLEEARKLYETVGSQLGGEVREMQEVTDLTFSLEKQITVRKYIPYQIISKEELSPLLLYIHGGGWTVGSIDTHDKVCRHLAEESKCMVMSVEYGLAPENPIPTGVNDVIEVLKYINTEGEKLGVDASNIAIGGDSAGGSISAAVSIEAKNQNIPLKGVVLFYPSTDLSKQSLYTSRKENALNPPLTIESYNWFMSYVIQNEEQTKNWKSSPLLAPSLEELPPHLIFIGGADILHDEGKAYAERLQEEGVAVKLQDIPGMIHGFIEMNGVLSSAKKAINETAKFLKECLKTKEA